MAAPVGYGECICEVRTEQKREASFFAETKGGFFYSYKIRGHRGVVSINLLFH